jgi:hypothetical protein
MTMKKSEHKYDSAKRGAIDAESAHAAPAARIKLSVPKPSRPVANLLSWWRIDAVAMGIMVALTAAGYFVGVRPVVLAKAEAEALQAALSVARERSDRALATIKNVELQLGRLSRADYNTNGEHRPVRLEPAHRSNQRLAQITQMATLDRLQIDQISAGQSVEALSANSSELSDGSRKPTANNPQPTDHSAYDIVPIRLVGTGTYQTIASFLHRLYDQMPDTAVVAFELTDNPTDPEARTVFHLDLNWFTAPALANVYD